MDKQEYVEHTKERIIKNFIKEMSLMSGDEILECGRTCPLCLDSIVDKADQDIAIIEGIVPSEVDHMIGVTEIHNCKPTLFISNSSQQAEDDNEEDNDEDELMTAQDDEAMDDYVMDALRDALDMLSDAPNAHLILAYMYTSSESTDTAGDIKGQSVIFGSRKFIDYLMNDIREQIDKNTNDGQVSLGDVDNDSE